MRKHYRAQIQEAIHEILSWKKCSYKFIPSEEISKCGKIWGEFKIEGVLMESMRRIDEMPGILEEFPDKSITVYRIAQEAPESARGNEQAVFELLAEEHTIEYLIAHAKIPEFDTYEALKRLKENGLIGTRRDPTYETQEAAEDTQTGADSPRIVKRSFSALVVFIIFSLSMFSGAKTSIRYFQQPGIYAQNVFQEEAVTRRRMQEKLHRIIESYRVEYGTYPQNLSDLKRLSFVTEQFMEKVQGFSFRYRLTPDRDTYTLL